MFDWFITEEESHANMNALGSMFDEKYRSRELPDDLFAQFFPPGITQEDEYYIKKEYSMIDDIELSRVEKVTMSDDISEEFIIEQGPKDMDLPRIYIEPDYIPALVTLKWYMDFMRSSTPLMLPYIDIAQMNIPAQAEEVAPVEKVFDDFFSQREGLIFGPTYQFTVTNPSKKYVVADIEEDAIVMLNTRMQKYGYKFVFSSKYPFREKTLQRPYKFAWMQFNPYHPLAPNFIQSYSRVGTVIRGTYKWGRKIKDFSFDTEDRMYRIHSEQWKNIFKVYGYMAPFDIVANFDIVSLIPELHGIGYRLTRYEGKYVEMYQLSNNVVMSPYSPMVNSRGTEIGYEKKFYSYYSSYPVVITSFEKVYLDVTSHFTLCFSRNSDYEIRIERISDGFVISRVCTERKRRYVEPKYYVSFTNKGHLEVYYDGYLEEYQDSIGKPKVLFQGVNYTNMPCGADGVLVNPFGVVDYDTFFRESKGFDMNYLNSMPSDNNAMFDKSYEESIVDIDPLLDSSEEIVDEYTGTYSKEYEDKQMYKNLVEYRRKHQEEKLSSWVITDVGDTGDLDVPTITRLEKFTPGMLLPESVKKNSDYIKSNYLNTVQGDTRQASRDSVAKSTEHFMSKAPSRARIKKMNK